MKYLQDLVPGCSKVVVVQHIIPQVIARSGLSVVFSEPLLGADELNGYSWQLVTAVHDEGDGLSLCERLS
jgi:hypothetical protein